MGIRAPLENEIELQILHYLAKVKKLFAWKAPTSGYFDVAKRRFRKHANPYAINGVSDILCLVKGHLLCLEVKTKKGIQSESQKEFEKRAKAAGASYFVVRSIEDVEAALQEIKAD